MTLLSKCNSQINYLFHILKSEYLIFCRRYDNLCLTGVLNNKRQMCIYQYFRLEATHHTTFLLSSLLTVLSPDHFFTNNFVRS